MVLPKGSAFSDFTENYQVFESNMIKIYNPRHLDITNFSIVIIPTSKAYVKHLETRELFIWEEEL